GAQRSVGGGCARDHVRGPRAARGLARCAYASVTRRATTSSSTSRSAATARWWSKPRGCRRPPSSSRTTATTATASSCRTPLPRRGCSITRRASTTTCAARWRGGALWDLVREARLAPELYVERVLAALPAERDEQIAGVILSRALDALERYVPPGEAQERLQRLAERTLLARMDDPSLDYGLRKAALDAFLTTARTPGAIAVLEAFLDGRRTFAGEPLGRPSRWAAVRRLVALDAPGARVRLAAERAR